MKQNIFASIQQAFLPVMGAGLAFRPLARSDMGPLFDATLDPRFNEYLLWSQPENREAMVRRIERLMQASAASQICALSVVDEIDGSWISCVRFVPWHDDPSRVEIGLWTHPRMWQRRISVSVLRLSFDVVFDRCDLHEIYGGACSLNTGSVKLMINAGMHVVDTANPLRPSEDARALPTVTMSINREQWATARKEPLFVDWDERSGLHAEPSAITPRAIGQQTIERMRSGAAARGAGAVEEPATSLADDRLRAA